MLRTLLVRQLNTFEVHFISKYIFCSFQVCLIFCAVLDAAVADCPQDSDIHPCKCTNPDSPIVECDSLKDFTQLRLIFKHFGEGPIRDVFITNQGGSVPEDFFYDAQVTGKVSFTCEFFPGHLPVFLDFDKRSFVSTDGQWILPSSFEIDGCRVPDFDAQILRGMTSLVSNYWPTFAN